MPFFRETLEWNLSVDKFGFLIRLVLNPKEKPRESGEGEG
jgi:hypothetical protein